MICSFCDSIFPDGTKNCPNCGAEVGSGSLADMIKKPIIPANPIFSTKIDPFSSIPQENQTPAQSVTPSYTQAAAGGSLLASYSRTAAGNSMDELNKIKGWNWGAFLFSWIWAFANGLPDIGMIALFLSFFPMMGFFMSVFLGIQGNEILWKRRKFESVRQFKEIQGKWAKAALICFAIILIFVFFITVLAVIGSTTNIKE